ncbi:WG repeat-containing protein [Sediminibacterium ginsengisoli]|uniref:WG containing repeat-containing protein n=1 Tax=Sediminibacterium ginsengisoli TaxID=413434 RepID=A0A1T4P750_9BACT|nr:WG repeat-containing protein [Sediminibacterium ginsengisoli]SJZ87405.1 WG containing repeat-containing protein [Sediminibacterium ginsengisoli]
MNRYLTAALLTLFFFSSSAQMLSTTILKDDFTDNRFGWAINKTDSVEYEVTGGKYILTNKSVGGYKSMRNLWVNRSLPYSVSASATWFSGSTDRGYGIFVNGGIGAGNGIEFAVSGNGYYRVIVTSGTITIPVSKGWKKSQFVRTGSGSPNVLRIDVTGDYYTFYLNENIVDTATLKNVPLGARTGFIVYHRQQILFDDFEAKQWNNDAVLPGKIVNKTSAFAGPVAAKPVASPKGKMQSYYYDATGKKTSAATVPADDEDDDWDLFESDMSAKVGLTDKDGYRLLDPLYKYISEFAEGRSFMAVHDTSYALVDEQLNRLTPFVFDHAAYFNNGYAIVSLGRLKGMIDKNGKTLLPFIYGHLSKPENGILYAELNGKAGIITVTGQELVPFGKIPLARNNYYGLNNGLLASADSLGKKYGIIDKTGKWVAEPVYTSIVTYPEGFYVVGVANPKVAGATLYGLMDKNAKFILQPVHGRISVFKNAIILGNEQAGMSTADFREKIKARYGLADKTGKLLTDMKYLRISGYGDTTSYFTAVAELKTDPFNRFGTAGLLDKRGKEVIPCIYENKISVDEKQYGNETAEYTEGLINLYKDGKYGYMNAAGKVVIPFIYTSAYPFYDGQAAVTKDGKKTYVDKTGKEKEYSLAGGMYDTRYELPPIRK